MNDIRKNLYLIGATVAVLIGTGAVIACKADAQAVPHSSAGEFPTNAAQGPDSAPRQDFMSLIDSEIGPEMIRIHFDAMEGYRAGGELSAGELEHWWGLAMESIRLSVEDDPEVLISRYEYDESSSFLLETSADPKCFRRCDQQVLRCLTASARLYRQCLITDGSGECEMSFEARNARCNATFPVVFGAVRSLRRHWDSAHNGTEPELIEEEHRFTVRLWKAGPAKASG